MEEQSARNRVKKTITSPTIFEHGKLPPQCVDIEEAVLGAIMLERDAFQTIKNILRPTFFYKESHQRIYEAINELNNNRSPVDILTVTSQLKKNSDLDLVGGAYYITMLTSRVASSANIEAHARIIQQKYLQREIIRISSEMIRDAFEDTTDVIDLISLYNNYGVALNTELGSGIEPTHISEITPQIFAQIQKNVNNETTISGIETGLSDFDKFTGGLQNSDLIIIAGETSMGKTSMALTMLLTSSKEKVFDIYSLEMSDLQLAARLMSYETKISSKKLLYYPLETWEIESALALSGNLNKKHIYINPILLTTGEYICNQIRINKAKLNTDCAIIDYLQLMTGRKGESPEQAVGNNAHMLKNLAKELNMPIILLSQLARDRQNPFPSLARLRQSGQIEEAADMVVFIYRPEYYKKDCFSYKGNNVNAQGVAEIIIAKGRNIGTTDFLCNFNSKLTLFENYTERVYIPPTTDDDVF